MNKFFERRYVIGGVFITIIFILLARLFYIQIIDDKYLQYANENVIREVVQFPARGPILDRHGNILVQNELVYDVSVIPKLVKPFDTTEFCRLLGIDKVEFNRRMQKAITYSRDLQSPFEKQLSPELYASLQERMSEFPGFTVDPHPVRTYPDSIAAQFLGYIGEVNDKDITKSHKYYRPGDYIGKTGVEEEYENVLRGQRGLKKLLVDAKGNPQGSYANGAFDIPELPGKRLISSLDANIQRLGEKLMHNKRGSIVAIEPSTGEVLAFVSSPTYDPNLMVGHNRSKNVDSINNDPFQPFNIRPIQAYYRPGSSFKPLSALIALQQGIINPQTTYFCPGYYMAGNRAIKCFKNEKHGTVNLSSAVAESCNGYFSMVFQKIIDRNGAKQTDTTYSLWRDKVAKFGLGSKLGIDLPDESRGGLPTAASYDKKYKKGGWRSSTVISLAIGQGELDATPLQLANIECIIANHGFYYRPHLIKAIDNQPVTKAEYIQRNYVGIDSTYFEPLIDGMQAVVDHGTAALSKIPGIVMCGKTGTAQNSHGEDNSVFVAFAPRENPKIAIAVVVENAGEGSKWAAPIASYLVEKYLAGKISRPQDEFNRIANANLLPDPTWDILQLKRRHRLDSLRQAKQDSLHKQAPVKSASNRSKHKDTPVVYLAVNNSEEDE